MSSKFILILAALTLLAVGIVDVQVHGHHSDGWYQGRVEQALKQANYNTEDQFPIRSEVEGGWVTLSGPVPTDQDRARVADAVRREVPGVRGIVNNLSAEQGICAREVLAGLKEFVDADTDQSRISYLVDSSCNVTLTGWVPTAEKKEGIGRLARSAPGVGQVQNNIEVGLPKRKLQDTLIEILRVQNIYFDFNKYSIRAESLPALDRVAEALKENPDYSVRIEGHTDAIHTEEYNKWLSQKRAEAVRDALVARGVDPTRLDAVGFGEDRPIASNDTPEGRSENRRIEFNVL